MIWKCERKVMFWVSLPRFFSFLISISWFKKSIVESFFLSHLLLVNFLSLVHKNDYFKEALSSLTFVEAVIMGKECQKLLDNKNSDTQYRYIFSSKSSLVKSD